MCKLTENEIKQIRGGDNTPLGRIYAENYQNMMISLSNKTSLQHANEAIEDALQEAFFVIRKKIRESTFKHENVCGFIVNTAYNKLLDYNKKQRRITGFEVDELERYISHKRGIHDEDFMPGFSNLDDKQLQQVEAILQAWEIQGNACKKLLTLLWEEERKLKDIWQELEYKNYDTTKSAKSRCVKKLKEIVNNLLNQ